MSVSQLPAITGPSSPEIGGLRHSLNNLAALCLRALGSQPSKVMTERRWLTSPSHSLPLPLIYRYWFEADKAWGHTGGGARGGEKLLQLYKLRHKAQHNQTMTFSQRPRVGGVPPLLSHAVRETCTAHMITQASSHRQKEWWTHTQRERSQSFAQQV